MDDRGIIQFVEYSVETETKSIIFRSYMLLVRKHLIHVESEM